MLQNTNVDYEIQTVEYNDDLRSYKIKFNQPTKTLRTRTKINF